MTLSRSTVSHDRARAASIPAAVILTLLAFGCGILKKPDLRQTAGIARLQQPRHPLILIHGFLGSKLRDRHTGKVMWGTMANILTGRDNQGLALALEDKEPVPGGADLEPFEIYDSLWGVEYYGKILRILGQAGGYRVGDIEHPKRGDSAFIFIYDWRQDNVASARRLAVAIEHLKAELGDPGLKFDLLTHSQGGLIARYYAKYGGVDVLDSEAPPVPDLAGAAHLNKVILLGTPNRGCLEALRNLHLGIRKFFRPMPPTVTFTLPALYQMLPRRGTVNFATPDGSPVHLDIYDPQTWRREEWSVFSPQVQSVLRRKLVGRHGDPAVLEAENQRLREFLGRSLRRAERFHRALDAPTAGGSDAAYFAFGSDCISTLKTAIVLNKGGKREILFEPGRFRHEKLGERMTQILYGPGDGTVLMQSLLDIPDSSDGGPTTARAGAVGLSSAFFFCESHGLLPNDPIFQNNLFYLLLWEGEPPPKAAAAAFPFDSGV